MAALKMLEVEARLQGAGLRRTKIRGATH
jgi:hypothetical protein